MLRPSGLLTTPCGVGPTRSCPATTGTGSLEAMLGFAGIGVRVGLRPSGAKFGDEVVYEDVGCDRSAQAATAVANTTLTASPINPTRRQRRGFRGKRTRRWSRAADAAGGAPAWAGLFCVRDGWSGGLSTD